MDFIEFFIYLIIYLFIVGWGGYALTEKNREWYYYLLLLLIPPIGFIVALFLKEAKKENRPSNDITNIKP